MKNQDSVGITFANTVAARGIYNNVVNISLAAYNFTPAPDGASVDPDAVIVSRLRLDKMCAIKLRDVLNDLILLMEPEAPQTEGVIHVNGAPETSH